MKRQIKKIRNKNEKTILTLCENIFFILEKWRKYSSIPSPKTGNITCLIRPVALNIL